MSKLQTIPARIRVQENKKERARLKYERTIAECNRNIQALNLEYVKLRKNATE